MTSHKMSLTTKWEILHGHFRQNRDINRKFSIMILIDDIIFLLIETPYCLLTLIVLMWRIG